VEGAQVMRYLTDVRKPVENVPASGVRGEPGEAAIKNAVAERCTGTGDATVEINAPVTQSNTDIATPRHAAVVVVDNRVVTLPNLRLHAANDSPILFNPESLADVTRRREDGHGKSDFSNRQDTSFPFVAAR